MEVERRINASVGAEYLGFSDGYTQQQNGKKKASVNLGTGQEKRLNLDNRVKRAQRRKQSSKVPHKRPRHSHRRTGKEKEGISNA